ncbi:conserved protein of unknown function [Pseudomonas sp. JV551A1]|uniref:RING-type E3 ubiquitin transferase n=1 Tax=Pseudomonas inefficax TaxID=2078786 RepID=A0AAQ1P9U7_9PSED|nr:MULTISPECIES: NEL-type E3 ubiquitin ligase domain-containing protein [Pseudomonas]SPO56411.1 conserved protein of unknown function [Pseudomonas sp. JV551A1]SPO62470.1 conserved protein of unknown function [Pseudomonas inefficax]
MTVTADSPQPEAPTLQALAQAYQDNLIASRQPAWLRKLTAAQLDELNLAMKTSLKNRRLVSARLGQIQRIDDFTVPLMQTALSAFDSSFDVRSMRFDQGVFKPVTSWGPNRAPIHTVEYKTIPLMEAVLWNFTANEASEGGQRQGNCLVDAQGRAVNRPSAVEFAQLCRELDLGAQYEGHLREILYTPWYDSGGQVTVDSLLERALRSDMLIDAYKARFHYNTLTDSELKLIADLCRTGKVGRLDGNEVKPRQLQLLGCSLEQIVVLDVMEDGLFFGKNRKRVLVYIPGDPYGPWSACDSLQTFSQSVANGRLRQKKYQIFFKRFLPLRERTAFFAQVDNLLGDITAWATRDLKEHMKDYPLPLFTHLAATRSRRVIEDSASILSPVVRLDRQLKGEHYQRLSSDGGLLLGLASIFVPEIGLALLAILAWEMLSEVIEGVEDWNEGDTSEAIDHFFNVSKRATEVAAMVAGGKLAQRAFAGSRKIDSLVATRMEDGSDKLWTMDIAPFRSPRPAGLQKMEQGIYKRNNDHWVEIEGHTYPVQRTADNEWQLQPKNGHGPLLTNNSAGCWRLQSDDPASWTDMHRMFRRWGEPFNKLSDDEIDKVCAIHGLQTDQLRTLHIRGEGAPAELLDTVVRVQLAERVVELANCLKLGVPVVDVAALDAARALPGASDVSESALAGLVGRHRRQLVGQLYHAWSAGTVTNVDGLMRMFPSLHRPAAEALLRLARVEDRQRFLETGRVSLRLAEAARTLSLRLRTIRVQEAFVLDTPQTADLARVALAMIKHVTHAPDLHWRLFDRGLDGPLLLDTGGRGAQYQLIHVDGQFSLFRNGHPFGAVGELFSVITSAFEQPERAAMELGDPFPVRLRARLAHETAQRRGEVERMLSPVRHGSLMALQRLDGNRLGFPLSGRGAIRALGPSALYPEVRRIYPHYDVDEINQWLAGLERAGTTVWEELPRLRQQLLQLEETLHSWHTETLQDATSRLVRGRIKERLIMAWRRIPVQGEGIDSILLSGLRPGRLPDLPADIRFSEITSLDFRGMELARVSPGFLNSFPNLRTLCLAGNRLKRLPNQLALGRLRVLNLYNNQIVLDAVQATVLASCESLEVINLGHNPLGKSFSVSGMSRLRIIRLNNTQIDTVPNGLEDCSQLEMADLRNNRITRLPQELLGLPSWTGRTIRLDGNALDGATLARLRQASRAVDSSSTVAERWATALPMNTREKLLEYWAQVEGYDNSTGVMILLRELQKGAAFRRQPRVLANRVYQLLTRMQSSERLREVLFEHVDDGLTCQDGHLWRFSMLEVRMKAWQIVEDASAEDLQAALLRFGRRQWRLEMVEELLKERMPSWLHTRRNVDPLEVVMGYQLALRDHLELPIEADKMVYQADAMLDARRIGRIRDEVLALETQPRLAEWLVEQPFWSDYLDNTYKEDFARRDKVFYRQLEEVSKSPPPGGQASIDEIMGEINSARQKAKRTRMIELTIAAMDTPLGGAELLL